MRVRQWMGLWLGLAVAGTALATGPATAPTADEQAMAAFWARMESSADAGQQALAMVAPFESLGGPADLPARIERWEASAPDADAVVLLAALACGHGQASRLRALCDRRDLLARWKQADAGNAWPWLLQAQRAQQAEDADALQQALDGIGASTRIEDGYRLTLAVLREAMQADASFSAMSPGRRAVAAFGLAVALATPSLQPIDELCPLDLEGEPRDARAALCSHLGGLLFDTAETSLLLAQHGARVARHYAADEEARARRNEDLAALQGLAQAIAADALLNSPDDDPAAVLPDELDQYLAWVIAEGEVAAMLGWLKRRAGDGA